MSKDSVVLHASNVDTWLSFVIIKLNGKIWKDVYEVPDFIGKMVKRIMGNSTVYGACYEKNLRTFVTCLSAVLHVVQYVKL